MAQLIDVAQVAGGASLHERRHLRGRIVAERLDADRTPCGRERGVEPTVTRGDLY